MNTTSNQISLTYPLKINNAAFLNPRLNGYFEIYAAPNGISLLQHIPNGSQPIAIFNSLDKSVKFFRYLDIPNFYNKTEAANLITNLNLVNYYTKNQIDSLIYNTNLVDYYTKNEVDTLLYTNYPSLTFIADNFYSKTETESSLSGYTTPAQSHIGFYSKAKKNLVFDTYTTTTQLYDDFYSKLYIDNMFF